MIHVVLEAGDGAIEQITYLGARATHESDDPRHLANIGHVIALVRQAPQPIQVGQTVTVYLEGHAPQRWRLDPRGPDPYPLITAPSTSPRRAAMKTSPSGSNRTSTKSGDDVLEPRIATPERSS